MRARAYVCGRTCIDAPAAFFDESAFPARQGRLAWTYLVLERHRTVTRDELIEAVWGEDSPDGCDRALSAILSKLRALLARAGIFDAAINTMGLGIRLTLPPDVWIDWEIAHADVERAARYCRDGHFHDAYGWALAGYMIAREGLLPGEEAPWLARRRSELQALLMRALDLLIDVYRATGNGDLAIQFAEEAIGRDPLREPSYCILLELYATVGNRSGVMSTYRRCSEILASNAGCGPSPATQASYRRALEVLSARA
jgi:DNA-binding SARP family transcriptional activator